MNDNFHSTQAQKSFSENAIAYQPLSAPLRITEHNWPAGTKPLVSICCITYNHKNYISAALDGFLMQETTFPVEILVHDDASTDGTADIVRAYAKAHPRLIFPILQVENQYSKGRFGSITAFPQIRGEFIAICEGDDYWVAKFKLEHQVRYLSNNPHVSLVHSQRCVELPDKRMLSPGDSSPDVMIWTLGDILAGEIPSTPTMMFRNHPAIQAVRHRLRAHISGDQIIAYASSLLGELHGLPEVLACYRFSGTGVWSSHTGRSKVLREIAVHRQFHQMIGLPLDIYFNRIMVGMAVSAIFSKDPISNRRGTNWVKFAETYKAFTGNKAKFLLCVFGGLYRRFFGGRR